MGAAAKGKDGRLCSMKSPWLAGLFLMGRVRGRTETRIILACGAGKAGCCVPAAGCRSPCGVLWASLMAGWLAFASCGSQPEEFYHRAGWTASGLRGHQKLRTSLFCDLHLKCCAVCGPRRIADDKLHTAVVQATISSAPPKGDPCSSAPSLPRADDKLHTFVVEPGDRVSQPRECWRLRMAADGQGSQPGVAAQARYWAVHT